MTNYTVGMNLFHSSFASNGGTVTTDNSIKYMDEPSWNVTTQNDNSYPGVHSYINVPINADEKMSMKSHVFKREDGTSFTGKGSDIYMMVRGITSSTITVIAIYLIKKVNTLTNEWNELKCENYKGSFDGSKTEVLIFYNRICNYNIAKQIKLEFGERCTPYTPSPYSTNMMIGGVRRLLRHLISLFRGYYYA